MVTNDVIISKRTFYNISMLLLGGFAEEMFFKGLLYRLFEEIGIPYVFNIVVVSILFAVMHWSFSLAFIVLFFISLFSLILFRIYPSILSFSIFHLLWNISTYL